MRTLDTKTLDGAAKYYAGLFFSDRGKRDRDWVMGQFYNFTYKDEFEYVREQVKQILGPQANADWNSLALGRFTDRTDEVYADLLKQKLAIDPDGSHLPGVIGSTEVASRRVGFRLLDVEAPWSIRRRKVLGLPKTPETRELIQKFAAWRWPIYAGEEEERKAGNPFGVADDLPHPEMYMALNTRISNEVALLMCNAAVDNLDEGLGAAVVQGRTGTQPADPDTAVTGTNLFTLVCTDPAFGNAADAAPGGTATASAITDDSSADATGTLGYCRASSTADGATPADDHIDGEAGTATADFVFNTLSIVSGSNVGLDSWTVTMPES
jgi:hypothetical protein